MNQLKAGAFEIITPSSRSSPSRRSPSSTRSSTSAAPRRGAGLPRVPLHRGGQRLVGKHFYRPRLPTVAKEFEKQFPSIELVTVDKLGGWDALYKAHFADGALFDQIYQVGSDSRVSATLAPAREAARSVAACSRLRPLHGDHRRLSLLDRPPPAGDDLPQDLDDRLVALLGDRPLAALHRRLRAQLRRLVRGGADQRRLRRDPRVGALALPLPGAASSTRSSICPSRCPPPSPGSPSLASTPARAGSGATSCRSASRPRSAGSG